MSKKKTEMKRKSEAVVISPPNFQYAEFKIRGTAPLVMHAMAKKTMNQILASQTQASGTKGRKKTPRDPEADYKAAMHIGEDGKQGIPAAAFRSAMIAACRATGFVMTKAKMSVFVLSDSLDVDDGSPLVHFEGKPELAQHPCRLESGVASVTIRPMWRKWSATVRLRYDGDQFGFADVANLLMRAGMQVGILEGRPFSKKSNGQGWGTFELVGD